MVIEPLARDVLAADAQALEQGRRLAGIRMGVAGHDGLADRGLARKADNQGKQRIHKGSTPSLGNSAPLNLRLISDCGAGYSDRSPPSSAELRDPAAP